MTTTWRVIVKDEDDDAVFASTVTADDGRTDADVAAGVLDALVVAGVDTTGWSATAEQPDTGPRI